MSSIEESVTAMIPQMAAEIGAKIKERTLQNMGDKLITAVFGPFFRGY